MTIRLRPEAEADLADAAAWYQERQAGLGEAFLDEVRRILAAIGDNPKLYPKFHGDIRRAITRRFPFAVFYVSDDIPDLVVVLGVLHASRDPGTWRKRI